MTQETTSAELITSITTGLAKRFGRTAGTLALPRIIIDSPFVNQASDFLIEVNRQLEDAQSLNERIRIYRKAQGKITSAKNTLMRAEITGTKPNMDRAFRPIK